jgi:hypothetical protein
MTPEEEEVAQLAAKEFPFSKSFRKSMKVVTLFRLVELSEKHPDWELNKVLGTILQEYPPGIPSKLLLEMTRLIANEWEKTKKMEAVAV